MHERVCPTFINNSADEGEVASVLVLRAIWVGCSVNWLGVICGADEDGSVVVGEEMGVEQPRSLQGS